MLTTLRFNLANTAIRRERLHGRDYIVAPMAMLTEGVHNGSGGPLLYREADIKKSVLAWNMKPIVVYHPQINGQGVSVCDSEILEAQQVGMVMHAKWDGKLRAEAWVDEARATTVDGRVVEALEQNKLMEVSTGLFTDNLADEGVWNGAGGTEEAYTAIATNHQPDHLALLPDQIGACSIADGAGLLQLNEAARAAGVEDVERLFARQMDIMRRMVGNAMSHGNVHSALARALRERFKPNDKQHLWIADVYDDKVIYEWESAGKATLHSLGYAEADNGVELSTEEPVEVVCVTEYRTPQGAFVGNEARTTIKDDVMDKKKIVDGLIANATTAWSEEDREALMGMSDALLAKVAPVANEEPKAEEKEEELKAEEPVKNSSDSVTTEQYIASAPPEIRQVLQNGLAAHEAEKKKLIGEITANESNAFTAEFLGGKGLDELRGLAQLANNGKQHESGTDIPMFYGGAATPAAPVGNTEGDEGLGLPIMNFDVTETAQA